MKLNELSTQTHQNAKDKGFLLDFISSDHKKPPFKTVVEIRDFAGVTKAMFHESSEDGYDYENEKPMVIHLICDFSKPVYWRLWKP